MRWLIPIFLLFFSGCNSNNSCELHLFMWADYIKPELIWRFEKTYNCRVVIDTYDSNEAMYAKLKLGVTGYDLIFPSMYLFTLMEEQGMLEPLNYEIIPNAKYLDPTYLKYLSESTQKVGLPYMISFTGLGYRKDKLPNFEPTWAIFGERKLKGRMTMLNDMRETLGACLSYLGYSINTKERKEIEEAADQLIKWKQNLAKFENEQYKNGIATAEFLAVQGYNGDIAQVMIENPYVGFGYPKEGTAFSIDLLAIPKHAPNKGLAHQFINYLLEPEIAAENIEFTQFLSPNLGAYEKLGEEIRSNPTIFPPQIVLDKSQPLEQVGAAIDYYIDAWDRAKAE